MLKMHKQGNAFKNALVHFQQGLTPIATSLPVVQMEEERRKHEPPNETERLQASANSHTRNRADALLTEQRDEVKHMNQMVQYSKCVTIR